MATIRKRGSRYQAQVRRKGYPPISRSFQKLADAREWARLIETRADRQELAPSQKELGSMTLADLVKRYQREIVPKKKGGDTETIVLKAFLAHPICRKRLSDLLPSDFVKYRDQRLKRISPSTLRRQLNPVRHMFRYAREEWELPVRTDLLSKLKFSGTDKPRDRRLREGELEALLSAATKTRNPVVSLVIRFALETAMRRGEMLALRWGDIDTERHSATVRESKNGYSRTIPLSPRAIGVLGEARELADNPDEDSQIFPISANALRLSWVRITKRAKIDDLHFHDTRHEAISRLFELGLTVPEVASISGHRDARMLLRYAHANHAIIRAKLLAAE